MTESESALFLMSSLFSQIWLSVSIIFVCPWLLFLKVNRLITLKAIFLKKKNDDEATGLLGHQDIHKAFLSPGNHGILGVTDWLLNTSPSPKSSKVQNNWRTVKARGPCAKMITHWRWPRFTGRSVPLVLVFGEQCLLLSGKITNLTCCVVEKSHDWFYTQVHNTFIHR